MSTHSGGVAGRGHGLIFCLVMRILLLCTVLSFPIIPGFVLAQENPKDREMCLMLLPWVAYSRPDLSGGIKFDDNVSKTGLAIVAHTRRKEGLNCVFRYEKPTLTYVHVLLHFETNQLVVVRLGVNKAGVIKWDDLRVPAK